LKTTIIGSRKKVSITKFLAIENFQSSYEWRLKMGFNCHLRNFDYWMAIKIDCGNQKLPTNCGDQKVTTKILWWPNLFLVTIYNKGNMCVRMHINVTPITKRLCHISFDNLSLDWCVNYGFVNFLAKYIGGGFKYDKEFYPFQPHIYNMSKSTFFRLLMWLSFVARW